MKLTAKKEIVLRFLAGWKFETPPDGPEISEYTGNLREWATPILISLEKQKMVERLGKSDNWLAGKPIGTPTFKRCRKGSGP